MQQYIQYYIILLSIKILQLLLPGANKYLHKSIKFIQTYKRKHTIESQYLNIVSKQCRILLKSIIIKIAYSFHKKKKQKEEKMERE